MNCKPILVSIFISFFIFSSCAQNKMKYVDLEKPYKMYFVDVNYQYEKYSNCSFIKTYGNFYIDQQDFLHVLKNDIIQEKSKVKNTDCFYDVTIMQEGEIKFGGFLNVENGILNISKVFNFDIQKFLQHKEYFKQLEAFEVNCYSLSQTKIFINELKKEGGYIYGYTGNERNEFFDFEGRMKLSIIPEFIKPNQKYKEIQKNIIKTFKSLDDIKIIHYSNKIKGDSIIIELLCNKDLSNQMPVGFEIIEPFTDSINLPFAVYDLSDFKIKRIAKENQINKLNIKDLNN